MLWSACGLTITKRHRTPLRIIFWMLWRWEEHQQVTYFPGQPCSAIAERKEADTKERWDGGEKEDVKGQGQMSRSHREKHIAFHQLAEREVIHNSTDTIWPWMCVWGVRSRHAVTGRQVKKRKKCPPQLPNSSGEKVRLDDKNAQKSTKINCVCVVYSCIRMWNKLEDILAYIETCLGPVLTFSMHPCLSAAQSPRLCPTFIYFPKCWISLPSLPL